MRNNVFMIVFLVCIGTCASEACEPIGEPPKDAREAFSFAGIVFTGKIEKVYRDKLGNPSIADVRVINYWKGPEWLRQSIRLDSSSGGTCPVHTFEEGKIYLIYVRPDLPQQQGNLKVDGFIDRVLEISKAKEDLRALPVSLKHEFSK